MENIFFHSSTTKMPGKHEVFSWTFSSLKSYTWYVLGAEFFNCCCKIKEELMIPLELSVQQCLFIATDLKWPRIIFKIRSSCKQWQDVLPLVSLRTTSRGRSSCKDADQAYQWVCPNPQQDSGHSKRAPELCIATKQRQRQCLASARTCICWGTSSRSLCTRRPAHRQGPPAWSRRSESRRGSWRSCRRTSCVAAGPALTEKARHSPRSETCAPLKQTDQRIWTRGPGHSNDSSYFTQCCACKENVIFSSKKQTKRRSASDRTEKPRQAVTAEGFHFKH